MKLPMPKIPSMSGKEFLNKLLAYGCVLIRVNGSHHKIKNTFNGKITVIPIHGGKDIDRNFMVAILTQLGISKDDFFFLECSS